MTIYVLRSGLYFLPKTAGRMSDTRNPIMKLITHPIATAMTTCPVRIPTITAAADGVSPK